MPPHPPPPSTLRRSAAPRSADGLRVGDAQVTADNQPGEEVRRRAVLVEDVHHLLVDLDEDGDLDAASCGFESKRLSIYLNDGEGVFERQDLDLAQESYDLRAVDMDGDGDLDLLNAGRATGNVAWYENPLRGKAEN